MIIAMDGTSGSGKSTLAKKLAKLLGFGYFSAGALYRAITVKAIDLKLNENDDKKLENLIENINIIYQYDGTKNVMLIDGIDVHEKLYTDKVTSLVSKIACKPFIREFVRKLQKETQLHNDNIVMEGRDIGSVIFPDAEMKIFVDCKIETRAKRRFNDFKKQDEQIEFETVVEKLKERDYRDTHRTISPLIMCEDSYLIDTSNNSIEECLTQIIAEIYRRDLISKDYLTSKGITLSK